MEALPTGHPGFTAVPTWLLGQASPIELAILLAIQEAPDQRISLNDMANRAGVCRRTASEAIRKLAARGWLTKEATTEGDGTIGANRYALKIWDPRMRGIDQPSSPPQPQQPRSRFRGTSQAPVELMAACSVRKGALFVYLALQLFEAPTISTLATVCCMAPDDVRRALKWLESDGWIQRIERSGASSLFRVFYERVGAQQG